MEPAATPEPPYFAVLFTSLRRPDDEGYAETAERMVELAREQPGFLGLEDARDAQGFGVTISYWRSLADIEAWRRHAEHLVAQRLGAEVWYEHYVLRVAEVRRQKEFRAPR